MSKDAGARVAEALGGVVSKIEKATDAVVGKLEDVTNETVNKLGRVETKYVGMFDDVNATLDDLISGHNGAPVEDAPDLGAFLGGVGGEARPNAATAAAPQSSALGTPTELPDWVKKPE